MIASDLFGQGLFPVLVFSGANAPTTINEFPRGEAVHYAEYAIEHGVPPSSVLVEPKATNTQQNLTFTRDLLAENGIDVSSVLLKSRPYQQRRAFATCRKVWPEVDVVCRVASAFLGRLRHQIGDSKRVIDMIVGDTQRIVVYAQQGFAIPQDMPDDVTRAYDELVGAGYTSRLITTQDEHSGAPSAH